MKLTRRQMLIAAAGTAAAANAAAQSAPAPAAPVNDPNQQALSDLQQNADDLAKIAIPMDVAPAFQFKA